MVNTRRTESVGSTPDTNTQPRTRRTVVERSDSSSVSESEDSPDEDVSCESEPKPAKRLLPKKDAALTTRVRELRSRFVYSERNFASLRNNDLKAHKRISLNERHSLALFASRNMHEDPDVDCNDSDDDYRSRRRIRRRFVSNHMDRISRRTALSLRPVSQKSYADSPSDTDLKRCTRQRKHELENMSWLADDQMHKVGYPNLNVGYSEEDSRDAQESRRNTRHSNRQTRNTKYLYDYETNDVPSRTRNEMPILKPNERAKREVRLRKESSNKENKEEVNINGHLDRPRRNSSVNEEKKSEENAAEEESNDSTIIPHANGVATNQDDGEEEEDGSNQCNGEINKQTTSESDPMPKLRPKKKSANVYSRRARIKKRFVGSSSSETEHEKKSYSLRTRAPKPDPISMQTSALRSHELPRSRRHFTRRREPSPSSDSSNSEDVRHSKPPHSKNEQKMKSGAGGSKIIPIGPETLDSNVRFSSIGGLDSHIQCLKEMILLPMMYPEVFRQFKIQPPRGVLFHGPPGTGKTLIARALANECSFGCRKVSFFMRKGADLLSKWIGESEKQLRLLFEQASEMQPSIIFFDELDGLAPVRSSRQDQVHASIVSTLLALMDGLDNRGEVIVIGATNRIDAIDPALRRPGRFDRELFFPLPAKKEREEILKVHVSEWLTQPSKQLLSYLAETAVGYCGSDLRALCSEAVIQGFRRSYPQVYNADHRLLLNPANVKVEKIDFLRAKSLLVPASHRVSQNSGRKLLAILEPLLKGYLETVFAMLGQTFPHALNPALSKVKLSPNIRPAQLLILGQGVDCGQTFHLAPAVLYNMEHIHAYTLDLGTLFGESGRSAEEACIQVFSEARRNVPSVIYIPNIDNWWSLVNETVKAILDSQLAQMDPNMPILLLATADTSYDNLPDEIRNLFSRYRKEVCELDLPTDSVREAFFKPLVIDSCLQPPRPPRPRPQTPPPLPRAKTPPPTPLTEEQAKKLYEHEEHTLRELRIFLRDICKKLANNKLFYMFTKPVDTEEVPDYTTIIKQPMDLETMMTKVDFHRYACAKDFLNDIDLICQNALEYNPAKSSVDKQIRHRACSLRDYAYTLIKNEMDSDFEDKCQGIAQKRHQRKASVQKYLPAYILTTDTNMQAKCEEVSEKPEEVTEVKSVEVEIEEKVDVAKSVVVSKKRRTTSWQRGFVKKRKFSKTTPPKEDKKDSSDESKKNVCAMDLFRVNQSSCGDDEGVVSNKSQVDNTTPLLINCDEHHSNAVDSGCLHSPKRRLSDLMSPSELLENPLEFDDIDQALNEDVTGPINLRPVQCDKAELEKVLEKVVEASGGCAVQSLLDLYNQLSRIVKKYSKTHQRTDLPQELLNEVLRFEKGDDPELMSEASPVSDQS